MEKLVVNYFEIINTIKYFLYTVQTPSKKLNMKYEYETYARVYSKVDFKRLKNLLSDFFFICHIKSLNLNKSRIIRPSRVTLEVVKLQFK